MQTTTNAHMILVLALLLLLTATPCQAGFLAPFARAVFTGERAHESDLLDNELALTVEDVSAKTTAKDGNKLRKAKEQDNEEDAAHEEQVEVEYHAEAQADEQNNKKDEKDTSPALKNLANNKKDEKDTSPALKNLALVGTKEHDDEQDDEHDDEHDEDDGEVQNADLMSKWVKHFAGMSPALAKLDARAEELGKEAEKVGATDKAKRAAEQAREEFQEAFTKHLGLDDKAIERDNKSAEM